MINVCQGKDTSVADVVYLWININIPDSFQDKLRNRQNMALNIYALCAYYFHPTYDNDKLSSSHKKMINAFLFKHLSGEGIEEWDKFITRQGILLVNMQTQYSLIVLSLILFLGTFALLYQKNITNPLVF